MDNIAEKAWGFWGKAKSQIEETVANMKAMEDKPSEAAVDTRIVPWDRVPENWASNEDDWTKLVKGVAGDEGTYLYGIERGLTGQESSSLKSAGIDLSHTQDDIDISIIHPDTLKNKPLADMRFRLVPKWTDEKTFWRNFLWKVRELGKTNGLDEARALLAIVNQQREDFPSDAVGKKRLPSDTIPPPPAEASTPTHSKVFQESEEALKLFRECLEDSDMSEHLQVAYDSCKDCQEGLQKEIDGNPDPAMFSKLLTLSGKVDRAISEYESRQSEKEEQKDDKSQPEEETAEEKPSTPTDLNEEVEPPTPTETKESEKATSVTESATDASFVKVAADGASPTPDADFAAMPWESDSDSEG